MTPTVGRIVLFHGRVTHDGRGAYAAIVTAVNADGTLDLTVFGPAATCFRPGIDGPGDFRAISGIAGTGREWWTWPPRTEEAK